MNFSNVSPPQTPSFLTEHFLIILCHLFLYIVYFMVIINRFTNMCYPFTKQHTVHGLHENTFALAYYHFSVYSKILQSCFSSVLF